MTERLPDEAIQDIMATIREHMRRAFQGGNISYHVEKIEEKLKISTTRLIDHILSQVSLEKLEEKIDTIITRHVIRYNTAHRYPMGKGRIPRFSMWNGEKLGYIEARKKIYTPEYAKNVVKTDSFKRLYELYSKNIDIILLDYDAYDHEALGMTLKDVINNPHRKMGHAFVLLMILKGELNSCINSTPINKEAGE